MGMETLGATAVFLEVKAEAADEAARSPKPVRPRVESMRRRGIPVGLVGSWEWESVGKIMSSGRWAAGAAKRITCQNLVFEVWRTANHRWKKANDAESARKKDSNFANGCVARSGILKNGENVVGQFCLSARGGKWEFARHLEAKRNIQLDGWRAFGVVGVMWHHWVPQEWRGPFPFEIGLFFFLTLTGFLITRILLREKAAGEGLGKPWRVRAYRTFQKRRLGRILVPCYAAMVFAIVVGASDIRAHPLAYFGHFSNFHMAWMDGWPSGTAHYWTLALQMQFYVLWPLLVFFVPRRSLGWVFAGCILLAPLSRWLIEREFPAIQHGGLITTAAFDYFGVGALLALAFDRGIQAGNRRIALAGGLAFAGYVTLYVLSQTGRSAGGVGYFQQTLLAVAFAGLISATLGGLGGVAGRLLEHPAVQHIGRLSYGLYLFHTPVPLFVGCVMPLLWWPIFDGPLLAVRLAVFALTSWGVAWLCWRWLEGPDRVNFLR